MKREDFMYRFLVLLTLSAFTMPALAERTVVTQRPYYNPYYAPQAYYGGDYIPQRRFQRQNHSVFFDINDLEKYAMNRNFSKDSDQIRLERLETLAFGAVQEGDIYARYNNVRNAILSRPKQNYKTSLLRGLSNYLNGQLTGFTPQLNQNINSDIYSYPSDYERKSYTKYSSPWGSGYKSNYYGMGSGTGVHILD